MNSLRDMGDPTSSLNDDFGQVRGKGLFPKTLNHRLSENRGNHAKARFYDCAWRPLWSYSVHLPPWPWYVSVLNIKAELRRGCVMKKDVAEASTTE